MAKKKTSAKKAAKPAKAKPVTKDEIIDLLNDEDTSPKALRSLLARVVATGGVSEATEADDDADDDDEEEEEEAPKKKGAKKKAAASDDDDDDDDSDEEESDDDEEEESEDDEDADEDEAFEMPKAKAIQKMKGKQLTELAEAIQLPSKGIKEQKLKALLVTVSMIAEGETDDLENDDLVALCKAIDLKPAKKKDANLEQIAEYFGEESEDEDADEEESDDDDEDESEDEDEESDDDDEDSDDDDDEDEPKSKKKASKDDDDEDEDDDADSDDDDEEDGDDDEEDEESDDEEDEESDDEEDEEDGDDDDEEEVDRTAVAKKAKLPDAKTMKANLAAFNEAAPKKERIKVGDDVKAAYRKLVEKLVDSDGKVAAWGKAYVSDADVKCCGLSLEEHSVKGQKGQFGKCAVTGQVFKVDDEGNATPYKKK